MDKILKTAYGFLLVGLFFFSCNKESFITSPEARLSVSSDSLFFDTVFTSVGSVTQSLKIFNHNSQKIKLSQIKLAGGNESPFKLNIDGTSANVLNHVEINGEDSLYVFVQVNVNPNLEKLPFVLTDSIQLDYNGNTQWIQLQAYGQNAHFLKGQILKGTHYWDAELPYVIMGGIQVDTGAVLHISAGTKIYMHADAPFLVDGQLKTYGTALSRIIFAGDRLDPDYKNLPAAWPGIYFRNTSAYNELKFVTVKNAYQGIIADQSKGNNQPQLLISQSIIDNIYDAGLLAIRSNVSVDNTLISNCGTNVNILLGGNYQFTHCTIASYGSRYITHKNPVFVATDFLNQDEAIFTAPLSAVVTNSILWGEGGEVENEIQVIKKGNSSFSVKMDHVLYKTKEEPLNVTFIASHKNSDPGFDSINVTKNYYDFHITQKNSPAIKGGISTPFLFDLEGVRRANPPDIGCYQKP